jgi:hypothetical protein
MLIPPPWKPRSLLRSVRFKGPNLIEQNMLQEPSMCKAQTLSNTAADTFSD